MIYEHGYVYELTGEQFMQIVARRNRRNDPIVAELIRDATTTSLSQDRDSTSSKSYSIPSSYYLSSEFRDEISKKFSQESIYAPYDVYQHSTPKFIVKGEVHLNSEYLPDSSLSLKEFIFEDGVFFSISDYKFSLIFYKCVFKNTLHISQLNINRHDKDERIRLREARVREYYSNIFIAVCEIDNLTLSDLQTERLDIRFSKIKSLDINFPVMNRTDLFGHFERINIVSSYGVTGIKLPDQLQPNYGASYVEYLNIELQDNQEHTSINLDGIKLKYFEIGGRLNTNNSVLKDFVTNILFFNDLNCIGNPKFHSVKILDDLKIKGSNLDKAEFINTNFNQLKTFQFIDSKISDISLTKCNIPTNIISEDSNDFTGIRDAIKQLRTAYSKSNDKIQEMRLAPLEYDAYYESLSWTTNSQMCADKVVLLLNWVTNGHGYNVAKAIVSTILSSVLMYTIYCFTLGFEFGSDIDKFFELCSYFLEFINPLHKAGFIPNSLKIQESSVSNFTRVWEGFSRIVTTYVIYQFIQSFRKFGK